MVLIDHLKEWARLEPEWCRVESDEVEVHGRRLIQPSGGFSAGQLDIITNTLIAACKEKGWLWNMGAYLELNSETGEEDVMWGADVSCLKEHYLSVYTGVDPFHHCPAFAEAYLKALRADGKD